jgi:cobalamin biosynthesis protein CobT
MGVFKEDTDTKRVIFNVQFELAKRLEQAKKDARGLGKRLDADTAVNKALEKFLKKAEKRIAEEMKKKGKRPKNQEIQDDEDADSDDDDSEAEADQD